MNVKMKDNMNENMNENSNRMYDLDAVNDATERKLPREKLESEGLESLSDTVLVKLMLGICNENARNLALISEVSKILSRNDNLERIFFDLKAVKGIKTAKASGIVAGFELFRRKYLMKRKISCPGDCFKVLDKYAEESQEHFIVIALNAANEVISTNVVSIGLANQTITHPREVFSRAIEARAVSIILAHNHPTGDVKPSHADIETTITLQKAGKIIGIQVIDHIIFGQGNFHSFAEHKDLNFT